MERGFDFAVNVESECFQYAFFDEAVDWAFRIEFEGLCYFDSLDVGRQERHFVLRWRGCGGMAVF